MPEDRLGLTFLGGASPLGHEHPPLKPSQHERVAGLEQVSEEEPPDVSEPSEACSERLAGLGPAHGERQGSRDGDADTHFPQVRPDGCPGRHELVEHRSTLGVQLAADKEL